MRRTQHAPGDRRNSRRQGDRQPGRSTDIWREGAGFLVACLLVGVAVTFDSAASDAFRLPKQLLAETLGLASLIPLWVAFSSPDERPWTGWPAALFAGAPWLLATALSAAFSRHPEAARDGLWHTAVAVACLVGWSVGLGRERLRRLLEWTLLPAVLLAVVGLLQVADLFEPVQLLDRAGARFEMVSLAGNVGDLAMALALPTLIALCGWIDARGGPRVRYGLLLALFGGTLLLTRTLAVLAAVSVGGLVIALLRLDRRRFARFALVAGAAALAGMLAVPGLGERVRVGADDLARGRLNSLLSGRLEGWSAAIWMGRQSPLTGVGVGAFAAEYTPARLALPLPEAGGDPQTYRSFDFAHNELLQLGAERGLVGLLALAWGAAVAWRALARRRTAGLRADVALFSGGATALAVIGLADFPFHLAVCAYPALLLLAWLLAEEREGGGR